MDDTVRVLLKKILALAERGATSGERENAERMLQEKLKKYGITMDQLLSSTATSREFTYANEWELRLFEQLVAVITGRRETTVQLVRTNHRRVHKVVYAALTDAEYAEISHLYTHYRTALHEAMDCVLVAFIQANNLGVPEADDDTPPRPLTDDEKRLLKIASALGATPPVQRRNLLKGKGNTDG